MKDMMGKATEPVVQFLKEKYNLDISVYDHSFLEKTIKDRMMATSCETENEYILYLERTLAEPANLCNQLGNSYSEFFRNPFTFSLLEQVVLPGILDKKVKNNAREIRIWSAGCASGQEPYSLAMLFDAYLNNRFPALSYRIFATDNSLEELDRAHKGIFDFKTVKNTRLEFAERYFSHNGEAYHLNKMLKDQVDFSVYDLLDKDSSSPPASIYGDFDLIMCSNVLFYYQPEYQQIILQKIYRSLKPDGFFVTGEAEIQIVKAFKKFNQFLVPAAVFVKK